MLLSPRDVKSMRTLRLVSTVWSLSTRTTMSSSGLWLYCKATTRRSTHLSGLTLLKRQSWGQMCKVAKPRRSSRLCSRQTTCRQEFRVYSSTQHLHLRLSTLLCRTWIRTLKLRIWRRFRAVSTWSARWSMKTTCSALARAPVEFKSASTTVRLQSKSSWTSWERASSCMSTRLTQGRSQTSRGFQERRVEKWTTIKWRSRVSWWLKILTCSALPRCINLYGSDLS